MASFRFRLRQRYWAWAAPHQIRGYLRSAAEPRLQIGTGPNPLPGWLNTTLTPFQPGTIFLDASRPFPMPDASFALIFGEHVIEHLEFHEAALMLGECFRALRSGGILRVATPDLAQIIALYTCPEAPPQRAYIRWIMDTFRSQIGEYNPAHAINQSFHGWRHKFIYDAPTLIQALAAAGFIRIERCEPGESGDDRLRGIEQHGDLVSNDAAMRYETMVYEARKP
ncbi:MAG: methyltransferase domain-containing protein [Chloroflexi bacterium]|nr:methyltransferase domain-containing protein [Chloroflexota bacterium]MCY4247335.1 methyltransferase domain-containing protein [Chloroflexota bacterium]